MFWLEFEYNKSKKKKKNCAEEFPGQLSLWLGFNEIKDKPNLFYPLCFTYSTFVMYFFLLSNTLFRNFIYQLYWKIWLRTSVVVVNLDSLRSLQFASRSVLILMVVVVLVSSTLRGCSVRGPLPGTASSTIVISSNRNMNISLMSILSMLRGVAFSLLIAGKKSPLKYCGIVGCLTGSSST